MGDQTSMGVLGELPVSNLEHFFFFLRFCNLKNYLFLGENTAYSNF